ncbi:MAG: malate synthase [Metallosphaera sp.]|uniref:malate synthase n=1 Tax=Metallosphaera sp. TaxID=2020860 RepID=UPI00317E7D1A
MTDQVKVEIDPLIKERYGVLFGNKNVNGKVVNVEQVIGELTLELRGEIERAMWERRKLLDSRREVRDKYSFPPMEEKFTHPVTGEVRTFREIVQGLIDNLLDRNTPLRWRLNENLPVPPEVDPFKVPGLEITGPWNPVDMAIKQINADVSATMGPDDEDAAPPDFIPLGSQEKEVGLYLSRVNEHMILSGEISEVEITKKGEKRKYRINKPRERWPTSIHRVPGMHLLDFHVKVNGKPAPSIIVDYVIHVLNDFEPLRKRGSLLYFYQPKVQFPEEASIIAKILWKLERILGAEKPGTLIKMKALYEEGNAGRFLPVIMWYWRFWLVGLNVGRWDYTASLIEMWNQRVLSDPQNGPLMGMTARHMMAYQRYNAILNIMAGGAPIGGMNAVMLYAENDPYGRARHNPVTLRSMWLDKMRERLVGLIFVPEGEVGSVTLEDILSGKVKGKLYDGYRQSWVASPDERYVSAGNLPLRAPLEKLQAMLDAPEEWETVDGRRVAPKVSSGLTESERKLFISLGLLNERGKITPFVLRDMTPDGFLKLLGGDLWDALYNIPPGEITVENIQHAFYMAANYGFQILNGNLAAAIDDYVLFPGRVVRFMNDLATYRIFVTWLWTVGQHDPAVTKDGWLKGPKLTDDGVIPADPVVQLKAGERFTKEHFQKLWELHNQWTRAFFEEYDRLTAIRIVASIISKRTGINVDKLVQAMIRGEAEKLVGHQTEIEAIPRIREIVSKAYGAYPRYVREISLEEASHKISEIVGNHELVRRELESMQPRFDRSKAPLIMDVLRRQMLCPNLIQHSGRVLFIIADKDESTREKILEAVYYLDREGRPLFRDMGRPSRVLLARAVEEGKMPKYALEAHDYVYDIPES